jgi:alkyl sulfatase BDS1-like metallo-beta-lactamase superfamily hydrolase
MEPVAAKIKSLNKKPIKAIIYPHPYADHTGGVAAFITQKQINKGKTADDLANDITIPDYLTLDPFTIQNYGNVKTNVCSFYTDYISRFDDNPANLDWIPKIILIGKA